MDNEVLYKQVIDDHSRNPYKYGRIDDFTHYAKGMNPSKGDMVEVFLKIENNTIIDCSFEGSGGAVFTASGSIMMELIENNTIQNAIESFSLFKSIFHEDLNVDLLGKLIVFVGIKQFPERIKCASLVWYTMIGALERTKLLITTEL